MFVLCVSGRIFRTKVALVSVGAKCRSERVTRWLLTAAARLAFYRSYRDELSGRDEAAGPRHQRGSCVSRPRVRPPGAVRRAGPERTVGIGLMDYYGNDDSHGEPDEVRAPPTSRR